jgi:hypothetical protein
MTIRYRAGGEPVRLAHQKWKKEAAELRHPVVAFVAGWNAAMAQAKASSSQATCRCANRNCRDAVSSPGLCDVCHRIQAETVAKARDQHAVRSAP